MNDLVLVFAAGLLGSVHCIGMCGAFVLAISQARDASAGLAHQAVYFLGKALTYTVLGAVVGLLGAALTMGMTTFQRGLSLVAGVVMILIGLGLLGVLDQIPRFRSLSGWKPLQSAMGYFLRDRRLAGSLGLGLLNGLLPCGLVYGMLAKAASTGSPFEGGLTMLVFGLATVPALLALGLTGHLLRPIWRARLNTIAGVVVVLLGLLTAMRGTPLMGRLMEALHMGGGHAVEQTEPGSPPHHSH